MPAIKRNPLLAGAYWENFQGVKFNTVYVWRKGTKGTRQYVSYLHLQCTVHDWEKYSQGANKIIESIICKLCSFVPVAGSVMEGLDGSWFKEREIRNRSKDDVLLSERTNAAKLRLL